MRAILEAYGKEILESVSEQFLDLAVEVRLPTISARELVNLLTKAKRLGYEETDIKDDDKKSPRLVREANAGSRPKPSAIGAPRPRGAIAGQHRPHFTTSSQPPPPEESRAPHRTNTAQGPDPDRGSQLMSRGLAIT